jgi:hypothetical protein
VAGTGNTAGGGVRRRRNCRALLQRSRETGGDGLRGYFAGSY